jgi:citrate lyase subunit beta/citryl-CoA lyase
MTASHGRVRRSVMFTPGTQMDRAAKMLATGAADTLIVDWEDAVAPADKPKARDLAREAWRALPRTRTERAIRVNGMQTEWHNEDVEAAVALAPDAIVLPKAERPEDVTKLAERLWQLETENSLRQNQTRILVIIESGRGVNHALGIAEASNRIEALVFGAEDYQADVGGRRRKDNLDVLWARSAVVAAAAAAGVAAVDQVYVDYQDPAGLKAEAEQGRDLGYQGKMVIHPTQVPIVNEAFTPSAPEIQRALRVLQAAQAAEKDGRGAFALEGRMVDRPLVEQARRVIEVARAAGRVA